MARLLVSIIGVTVMGMALFYVLRPTAEAPAETTSVSAALGGENTEGYRRAYAPRPLVFPEDHGPHPDFRTEWWYVTGNLADAQGRRFGYQLTLFRLALSPQAPPADSAWRTNQIYMGHFALTDVEGERHYGFERFSRAAVGLAGAQAAPFRVWLEDWRLEGAADSPFPMRIRAAQEDSAIDLYLESAKPLVLQGEQGLSRKSAEPGNASYYYSYTRLPTRGTLHLDGQSFAVSGASWLDREWSTSALGPQQSGWDWFALQLEDGRELMFYRLRLKEGGVDPLSSGVLVAVDGSTRPLRREDVELKILDVWTSPKSGDRYPVRWALRVPGAALDLVVTPRVMDQEMRVSVRYWEGAVVVEGRAGGQPASGQGYLEMTRYEGAPDLRGRQRLRQ